MIICKHKISKKYFIVIEENIGSFDAIHITPEGKIKTGLNFDVFVDDFEIDNEIALSNGYINEMQYKSFLQYRKHREEENYDKLDILIDEMSEYERNILVKVQ